VKQIAAQEAIALGSSDNTCPWCSVNFSADVTLANATSQASPDTAASNATAPTIPITTASVTHNVTVLFYWQPNCPHCDNMRPSIEKLNGNYPSVHLVSINTREDPPSAIAHEITGTPTTIVFNDGKEVSRYNGEFDITALIDNTYPGTSAQMWARIQDACQKEGRPFSIDVVIQNHIELDHSGALNEIHKRFPAAPIYITEVGAKGLKKHYASLEGVPFTTVKTGDELALGGKTCTFLEAPLLHWPDSLFTFLKEDGILFSNDAFSQHLCLAQEL